MLRHMNHKEIEELGLTFELSIQRTDGSIKSQTVELIPGGSQINVTKENAIRYVHLVAHRRLNIETSKQTNAFLLGFRDLIPAAWVRLFSPYELQRLISGDDTVKGFDVSGEISLSFKSIIYIDCSCLFHNINTFSELIFNYNTA